MSTVNDAKEALGNRLSDIRKDARLTGRELAALTGWHFTKISKIEHGRTMPSDADLELWCFHCRAESELPDLLATARTIEKAYAELRRLHRAGTARYQRELQERDQQGRRFRTFTTSLVPGPVQIADYAATILTDAVEMLGHPADIEQTVQARMERAKLVGTASRLYHFVLLENVLNAGVVPVGIMRAQLAHMLTVQPMPNVNLGIIPRGKRRYMPLHEFTITDDTAVTMETFSAIIKVTRPREIAVYAKVFDHFSRQAVYGQQAKDLITEAHGELEQQQATS